MSFAGCVAGCACKFARFVIHVFCFGSQHDTVLNVTKASLLASILKCFASLYNDSAIAYRHQNGVSQRDVAIAVVVQLMVPSRKSGVMFTANAVNGSRRQIVRNKRNLKKKMIDIITIYKTVRFSGD